MKKLLLIALLFSTLRVQAQEIINYTQVGEVSFSEMVQEYGIFIQNGIKLFAVEYTSTDLDGQEVTVSGLAVIPDVGKNGMTYPRLIYQHGTVDGPDDVPSNLQGGYQLAAIFGGMGYITLAPDFLGLGVHEGIHPYVHAESEAQVAVDFLKATDDGFFLFDEIAVEGNQLYITGYSQGGHAAMAAYKMIEEQYPEYDVTAAAPMSGPYDISGAMIDFTLAEEEYFFPGYLVSTALSYQAAYGNIYNSLDEFFQPEFIPMIEQFANDEIGLFELNDFIINTLIDNYGASIARYALTDQALMAIEDDPDSNVNQALEDNDLYDWSPQAPLRMYYCMADDQVTFQNSVNAEAVMLTNGAVDTEAIDVNSNADHGGCVEPAVTSTIFFFGQYYENGFYLSNNDFQAQQLSIAPNPANGQVLIDLPQDLKGQQMDIQLFDMQGRMIQAWQIQTYSNQIELQFSDVNPGMYTLQMQSEQQRFFSRLVVE